MRPLQHLSQLAYIQYPRSGKHPDLILQANNSLHTYPLDVV